MTNKQPLEEKLKDLLWKLQPEVNEEMDSVVSQLTEIIRLEMLAVIGDNEVQKFPIKGNYVRLKYPQVRNKLRSEQRQRLESLLKGEKV